MDKYDIKREHRALYSAPTGDFVEVDVPELRYLAVDGTGDPNVSPAYRHAVEALYSVSYTVKFTAKKELGRDCVVGPLEGLWWAADPSAFAAGDKDSWSWRMLIAQPPWVTDEMVAAAVDAAATTAAAKKKDLPALRSVTPVGMTEGRCLQILHIGPYGDEGPTLARLHGTVMPQAGLTFNGPHHEIYLSDPRRTSPEKLKTILRQPVVKK